MKLFNKKGSNAPGEAPATPSQAEPLEQAAPPATSAAKPKIPLSHRTAAKVAAFILVICMAFGVVCCGLAAFVMLEEDVYTTPQETFRHNALSNLAKNDAFTIADLLLHDKQEQARQHCEGKNILHVSIKSEGFAWEHAEDAGTTAVDGHTGLNWEYDRGGQSIHTENYTSRWTLAYIDGNTVLLGEYVDVPEAHVLGSISATITLDANLPRLDTYAAYDRMISVAYALRYWVYALALGPWPWLSAPSSFCCAPAAAGRAVRNPCPAGAPGCRWMC